MPHCRELSKLKSDWWQKWVLSSQRQCKVILAVSFCVVLCANPSRTCVPCWFNLRDPREFVFLFVGLWFPLYITLFVKYPGALCAFVVAWKVWLLPNAVTFDICIQFLPTGHYLQVCVYSIWSPKCTETSMPLLDGEAGVFRVCKWLCIDFWIKIYAKRLRRIIKICLRKHQPNVKYKSRSLRPTSSCCLV